MRRCLVTTGPGIGLYGRRVRCAFGARACGAHDTAVQQRTDMPQRAGPTRTGPAPGVAVVRRTPPVEPTRQTTGIVAPTHAAPAAANIGAITGSGGLCLDVQWSPASSRTPIQGGGATAQVAEQ